MSITISSVAQVAQRIAGARDVAFGAYFLPAGEMREALEAAARRGAHVTVSLQRDPYPATALERVNASAARELREAGARVTLFDRERVPFHCKAAVCDGVAYLDDRNWARNGGELVVADDDVSDVAAIRAALEGNGSAERRHGVETSKADALNAEAALIDASPSDAVIVATEALGGCAVTAALRRHAAHGAPTTLLVSRSEARGARERSLIAGLRRDGVTVRETDGTEKLALAGNRAWIGSANATAAFGAEAHQIEWGLVTDDAAVVGAVRSALAA